MKKYKSLKLHQKKKFIQKKKKKQKNYGFGRIGMIPYDPI